MLRAPELATRDLAVSLALRLPTQVAMIDDQEAEPEVEAALDPCLVPLTKAADVTEAAATAARARLAEIEAHPGAQRSVPRISFPCPRNNFRSLTKKGRLW